MISLISSIYEVFVFRKKAKLLYNIDPRIKMVQLIITLITIALTINITLQLFIMAYLIAFTIIGADVRRILRSIRAVLKMLIMFYIIIYVLNSFPQIVDLNVAFQSLIAIFRFFMLIYSFSLFFTTTQLDDLAQSLCKLKVPYHIAFTLTLSVRFIPTVAKDFLTVYDAQRARGLEMEKGSFLKRARKFLALLIPVFIVSFLRVDRIAEALETRAFGLVKNRTFLYEVKVSLKDIIFLTIATIPLLTILYLQYYSACF